MNYDIGYTTENIPVAIIEENILDGVPKSDWVKTAKKIITDKFSVGIPISGRLIKVNKITKSEFTNSKYSKYIKGADGTIYADKFKTANNLDDVILATTNYINEDLNHERTDNIKEFARGNVLIRVGNNDYSAKVIVGFTNNQNMVLYDIVDFKKTDFEIKKKTPRSAMQNAGSQRNEMSSNNSIPTDSENVNTKLSLPSDTEYLELAKEPEKNEAKLREMVDKAFKKAMPNTKAVTKNGMPRILYHRTNSDFTIFDTTKSGSNQGKTHGDGIYLSSNINEFDYAGNKVMKLYFEINNPFEMEMTESQANEIYDKYFKPFHNDTFNTYRPHVIKSLMSSTKVFDYLIEAAEKNGITTSDILSELGFDGVHDGSEWVAFDNAQVKSADLVTYDDDGNVIPISERFNSGNADIRYSLPDDTKYWYPNMTNKEIDRVRQIAKYEVNTTNSYLNYNTKWLYNDRNEISYFALYSTEDEENPTILYACRENRAKREKAFVDKYFKDGSALKENERRPNTINEILKRVGNDSGKNIVNSRNAVNRGSNNGNAEAYSRKSSFRPSAALLGCLENIARTEERPEISRRNGADGLTPAFSMPENKYSIADEQWDEAIETYGAIDENAEVKVPKSVDGEKAVTRLVNNVLNHAALSEQDLQAVKMNTVANGFSHTVFSDEKAVTVAENKFEKGRVLYDITKIKVAPAISEKYVALLAHSQSTSRGATVNSIPTDSEKVNTKCLIY